MKSSVPFILSFVFLLAVVVECTGQIRTPRSSVTNYSLPAGKSTKLKRWFLPGLVPDRDRISYRPPVAYQSLAVSSTALLGDEYWLGSVTQQSYNKGKIGRYYYWDMQGNLRGSYLFLDIAGKNKRGLKLVFPRHRSLF